MSYRTDRQRAEGHGSAREGTHHWWLQRVTAIAMVPLTLAFVLPMAGLLGDSHDAVRAYYASPLQAIVAILFLGTLFLHLKLGLQVVIEDYIHARAVRTTCLLLNTFLCWTLALTGILSVIRMALGS